VSAPVGLVVLALAGTSDESSRARPPRAGAVVHLLDAIGDASRSTLASPALSPPEVGEVAPRLGDLESDGTLPDGRSIHVLPCPVHRGDVASLRLEPDGPRPQLVPGDRFVPAERLSAFRTLHQRVGPNGSLAYEVERPTRLKLPIQRTGPAARLTLVGGPFPPQERASVSLEIDGRRIEPRADGVDEVVATLAFDLPDALGLTAATLAIDGTGGPPLLLSGYELEEAGGRDRALVAAGVDPAATRLVWRPAPPAPVVPLRASRERAERSDVLLLPGRVGLTGVAPERVHVEAPGSSIRFEAIGPEVLAADIATATFVRFTLDADASGRALAPLLLQPQAEWLRPIEPMRGAGVAEPVHPLVDHWQVGNETRRALALATGGTWRVALPADASRIEFELASLAFAADSKGGPRPRVEVAVAEGSVERPIGAPELPDSARADRPERFDPVALAIPPPIDATVPRALLVRVVQPPGAPPFARPRTALVAEPRVVTAPRAPGADPGSTRPRNLVVFLVDTLRADHVHCIGGGRETTPNVDALARDGVLFRQARSQAPWTRPSVATLFTGLLPEFHTVTSENGLPRAASTLAERMRAAGYETAAFTANAQVHAPGLDFEQGFDRFVGFQRDQELARSDEVVGAALPWLDAHADRPFFLYVHTIDPHDPYDPPAATRGKFEAPYRGRIDDAHASIAELTRLMPLDAADRAHVVDLYDEEIAFADAWFGHLVGRLKELGLYDDTVVLFLSDHGEELLDHGKLGHPRRLWDEVLHVPMVLKLCGPTAPRGGVVDGVVRTMDWLPTFATFFDLPSDPPGFEGVDLAPAWHGDGLPELDAIAQTEPDLESFQHGRFKLLLEEASRGAEATARLFDLVDDPREQRDLSDLHPKTVASLRELLFAAKEADRRRGFTSLAARPVPHFDPDVERALRQLGYVGGAK
jgi:arylsulfatase A-like enzyme